MLLTPLLIMVHVRSFLLKLHELHEIFADLATKEGRMFSKR